MATRSGAGRSGRRSTDVDGARVTASCVVTGGASGIGRALCQRFAAEGAAGGGGRRPRRRRRAGHRRARIGDRAHGRRRRRHRRGRRRGGRRRTEAELGPIDLFGSNAGILGLGGIEAPDETWQRIWEVNVMAHVYAARAVLPRMLERGGGYLLSTASAAGLLSQPGDAPYTVTKHAAVALAEWLAITYGDQGIKVSCLCPMAVDTAMLGRRGPTEATGTERPGAARRTPPRCRASSPEPWPTPWSRACRDERFLILPHPEVATYEQRRAADRDRWLAGMRRLSAALMSGARGVGTEAPPRGTDTVVSDASVSRGRADAGNQGKRNRARCLGHRRCRRHRGAGRPRRPGRRPHPGATTRIGSRSRCCRDAPTRCPAATPWYRSRCRGRWRRTT